MRTNRLLAKLPVLGLLFVSFVGSWGCNYQARVGVHRDAGKDGLVDSAKRIRCGRGSCAESQVCCNESCGICAAPGGTCTQQACPLDCRPMDVAFNDDCTSPSSVQSMQLEVGTLSAFWDGTRCIERQVNVCSTCEGTECLSLFASRSECEAQFAACAPGSCRSFDARAASNPTVAVSLGWKWNGSACQDVVGETCFGADCSKLFASQAACKAANAECIEACRPTVARGTVASGCDEVFGYRFNGRGLCEVVQGCTCEGPDCADLYPTQASCIEATQACVQDACSVDTDCAAGYECEATDCASTAKRCMRQVERCPHGSQLVCGCNRNYHGNSCLARVLGDTVLSDGLCL